MKHFKNFASDNHSGVHPEIMKAILESNNGYAHAYGDDPYTHKAIEKFKAHFGENIEVYFVLTGTAANILSLKSAAQSYNSVICAETAHINTDECGAPESFVGCKLIGLPTEDGKLTAKQLEETVSFSREQHFSQPKAISISQPTERGTVYTPDEIKAIADFAHRHDLYLHMDGARLCNAAAALNLSLKDITASVGVDVLSFGGTKNGMMFGEAVVFFNKTLASNLKYIRKQAGQLISKMRYLSVQFDTLLSKNLWLANAKNANKMAKLLAEKLSAIPQIRITEKVEANSVFAIFPPHCIAEIQDRFYFHVWDEKISEVRLMTSFDTSADDVTEFVNLVKKVLAG